MEDQTFSGKTLRLWAFRFVVCYCRPHHETGHRTDSFLPPHRPRPVHYISPSQRHPVGLPDGIKVDERGNVFASAPGGVAVISPSGEHLGTVVTGGVFTANMVIGGDGYLYMAASDSIMRVKVLTKAPA